MISATIVTRNATLDETATFPIEEDEEIFHVDSNLNNRHTTTHQLDQDIDPEQTMQLNNTAQTNQTQNHSNQGVLQ